MISLFPILASNMFFFLSVLRMDVAHHSEAASPTRGEELPGPSVPQLLTPFSAGDLSRTITAVVQFETGPFFGCKWFQKVTTHKH